MGCQLIRKYIITFIICITTIVLLSYIFTFNEHIEDYNPFIAQFMHLSVGHFVGNVKMMFLVSNLYIGVMIMLHNKNLIKRLTTVPIEGYFLSSLFSLIINDLTDIKLYGISSIIEYMIGFILFVILMAIFKSTYEMIKLRLFNALTQMISYLIILSIFVTLIMFQLSFDISNMLYKIKPNVFSIGHFIFMFMGVLTASYSSKELLFEEQLPN